MLLLDSASVHLTNMEQTARKEGHQRQVVARSYEIDALRRALKNQLTQIKGRIEKDCVYPKRSEKRNFRFGKRDVIHQQLVDDVRQRRKFRKFIMAAESKIHNEQTTNTQAGQQDQLALSSQFLDKIRELEDARPGRL